MIPEISNVVDGMSDEGVANLLRAGIPHPSAIKTCMRKIRIYIHHPDRLIALASRQDLLRVCRTYQIPLNETSLRRLDDKRRALYGQED